MEPAYFAGGAAVDDRPWPADDFERLEWPADDFEGLEDKLAHAQVSSEFLLREANSEDRILAKQTLGGQQLRPLVRQRALACILELVKMWSLPAAAWWRGVALLDAWYAARDPNTGLGFPDELFTACLVVVRVMYKAGGMAEHWPEDRKPGPPTDEQIGRLRQRFGWGQGAVQLHDFGQYEMSLLHCVNWRVNVMSLESWLDVLETRFDVITGSCYADSMMWATEVTHKLAYMLVGWRPSTEQRRPLRLARGLLVIGMLRAELSPREGLRWQLERRDGWEPFFEQSPRMQDLPEQILQSLAVAAHRSVEEVRRDYEFTMGCLLTAISDLTGLRGLLDQAPEHPWDLR